MPVLLSACRVLPVLRGLQVLPLGLRPFGVLILQLTALVLALLLHVRVVSTVFGVGILLEALSARCGHSGGEAFARGRRLPRLPLMLMKCREGVHGIGALARIVEGVVANTQRLLAARRQLGLLMQACHMHGQRLALRAHQLVVASILVGRQLIAQ